MSEATRSTDMTLAVQLGAVRQLADPEAAFTDARRWTKYVGVVSEEPTYVVTNFMRKHRIRQDFFSGPRGIEETLENVRSTFSTDRYVLIGVDETAADAAATAEWTYQSLAEAATAAGWELGDAEGDFEPFGDRDRTDWP